MGAMVAEKRRMAEAEDKRRKRKDLTTSHPPNTSTHVCHICKTFSIQNHTESASSATLELNETKLNEHL